MRKRWPAAVAAAALAASLLATSALTAGQNLLPSVNVYEGFPDVQESDWFYQGVKTCYEAGLMTGTDHGYAPESSMLVSEAATIAARLREIITRQPIPDIGALSDTPLPWYQKYISYLSSHGIRVSDPEKEATRAEFFTILSAVTTNDLLEPINSIAVLPDTNDRNVLAFYNAGILTGTDEQGSFNGDKGLQRSEVAVMVARLADPAQRKSIILPGQPQPSPSATPQPSAAPEISAAPAPSAPPAVDNSPTALIVNGETVTRNEFIQILNQLVYEADYNLYLQGTRLDWSNNYNTQDLKSFFINQALEQAVQQSILEKKAEPYGCAVEDLPAHLFPSASRSELSEFAQKADMLCATHILVSDEDTAKAVLDGLNAAPTLEQFNALLAVFGTDPGMASNPNGYLFTGGQMVSEFENAVRELKVGTYTTEAVRSTYGYHIIWRLDPLDHPDLLKQYQTEQTLSQLNGWIGEAQVKLNSTVLDYIDPEVCYEAYLKEM